MKKFNTTGPCFPGEHYMLPALDRLPGIREFVADGNYFVIHAPRQTGKTTALKALVREINEKGDMFALYCSLETLQDKADPDMTNIAIRETILSNARRSPYFPRGVQLPPVQIDAKTSENFKGDKSYVQCAQYLDSLGLGEGWIPVFDKSKTKSWDEKIFVRDEHVDGKTIHVVGL